MRTYAPKPQDIERGWYVVDAQDAVLGRLATEVAAILRGKHKPIWAPNADVGDHVIVVNAGGIQLSGDKGNKKMAYRHSGYPGGLTATKYSYLLDEKPTFVIEKAVKGMLPHNRLGRSMVKKLSVYEGSEHPHSAQQPQPLKLGDNPKWNGLPVAKPKVVETEEEAAGAKKPAAARAVRAAKLKAKPEAKKTATRQPEAKKTATRQPEAKKTATRKPATKPKTATKTAVRKPRAKKTEEK